MPAPTVCALDGCPNLTHATPGGYCNDHLAAGAIIDALDVITWKLEQVSAQLEDLGGSIPESLRARL